MTNGNDSIHNSEQAPQDGLTKREYFAAMAMQGLVTNNFSPQGFQNGDSDSLARVAVAAADALIEQLNKRP